MEERLRSRFSKLLNILAVVGFLWIFSGPYIARKVFTSENALKVDGVDTYIGKDKLTLETFTRIKTEIEAIPSGRNRTQILHEYVHDELSKNGEVYTQPLRTVDFGRSSNIYSYVRSQDGYGQECIVLTAPLQHEASIVYVLTFVEMMATRQPNWQSKDLLVLFYPESDYQASVREFLDAYYGVDGLGVPLGSLQGPGQRIQGRSGYMRQSFPLVIKDFNFTSFSVLIDGVNGQLSDIDYYHGVTKIMQRMHSFKFDITSSNYFQKNTFLNQVIAYSSDITKSYLSALEAISEPLELSFTRKGSLIQLLEVMKNALFGRLQHPHPYFIEKGVHSATIISRTSSSSSNSITEKDRVSQVMNMLEIMVRANDQLDEQLHAGFFFYILTSPNQFIGNEVFVWAFALIIAGVSIPVLLQGVSHHEKLQKLREENPNFANTKDYSKMLALLYMLMVYGLGFLVSIMPQIYKTYVRGIGEKEFIQAQSLPNGYNLICGLQTSEQSVLRHETVVFTLRTMSSLSLLCIGIFKMIQGKMNAPYLWLELKVTNQVLLLSLASALVLFQYPLALMICLIMVVMRSTYCMVPMTEVHDFTWRSYFINATFCVVWLTLTLGGSFMLLFGTVLDQAKYDWVAMQEKLLEMAQSAMLDYECAGSRLWLAIVMIAVPNLLILFKIISN